MAADPKSSNGATAGAGAMLQAIRRTESTTRAELVDWTGLARSTVAQRIEALLAHDLVVPVGENASTGGRPPQAFAFNAHAGVILTADLGATHGRLAVTDLRARVIAEESHDIAIADGPDAVLTWLEEAFRALLETTARTAADVRRRRRRGARPGRVRHRHAGRAADHAGMGRLPGGAQARRALRRADARGQRREHHGPGRALDGRAATLITCCSSRSAPASAAASSRTAGSIAERWAPPATSATSTCLEHDDVLCRCGNQGCLEAVAGGAARGRQALGRGDHRAEHPRRRHPRARGPPAGRAARATGRPRARGGARLGGELLQPGHHRDRR